MLPRPRNAFALEDVARYLGQLDDYVGEMCCEVRNALDKDGGTHVDFLMDAELGAVSTGRKLLHGGWEQALRVKIHVTAPVDVEQYQEIVRVVTSVAKQHREARQADVKQAGCRIENDISFLIIDCIATPAIIACSPAPPSGAIGHRAPFVYAH